MEKQSPTKNTPEAKRLEEIFAKLPDKDLKYWKDFYKKDLNSESKYLQERAKKLLVLIEEAENLLTSKVVIPEVLPPEKVEREPVPPAPLPIIDVKPINKPTPAPEKTPEPPVAPPAPPVAPVETTTQPTSREWDETPLIRETPDQASDLNLDLNSPEHPGELIDLDLNPQEVIEKKQEQQLVESLTPEEVRVAEEEMRASTPLSFEPEKTKTDIGLFLRNQVVKLASGFDISERMRSITKKIRKGVLLSTGILVLWPSVLGNGNRVAYTPDNVTGKVTSISEESLKQNTPEQSGKVFDMETYNKLPPGAKNIYLYATNLDSSYVIVDKPTATMFVIGKDKKLMSSFPVLLGKVKGEAPNRADAESDSPGLFATTPAGKYTMSRRLMLEKTYLEYDEGRIFNFLGGDGLSLHSIYPKELKQRTRAMNTPDIEDNRLSWGCINITRENFDRYFTGLNNAEGRVIFITPDNVNYALNPETGKVESAAMAQVQIQTKGQNTIS